MSLPSPAGIVHILRGVDLAIAAGEAVAIVGPSGAGKSTLMMIAAGLEKATSGKVVIAGQDLTAMSEDELALFRRRHIGIVFQSFHLVPTMSALENVAIPLELAGAADAFERAAQSLASVGLAHRISHYPDQLSGGEQQRVALARAFVASPPLLLADEPTGNLDLATGAQVMDLLFEKRRTAGATLILITHDRDLAARADRIVRLVDGRVDGEGADAVSARRGIA
ncbi:MAG: ABC transporter ATP-binding protein [Proteobacteria bacterium]|nr:ABC transporter ATP-binding protein [Pseudomonadota bacterium]MBI3499252.1 ABC transporter ATP-binding protein [Pseudomonadota bacterium]